MDMMKNLKVVPAFAISGPGMMTVPDRILLAGNNAHVGARGTPRELQLENSIIPTSPEHVSQKKIREKFTIHEVTPITCDFQT